MNGHYIHRRERIARRVLSSLDAAACIQHWTFLLKMDSATSGHFA